jgi:multidrug resistance efflux pump
MRSMKIAHYVIGLSMGWISLVQAAPILLTPAQLKQANIQTIRLSPPSPDQTQWLQVQGQVTWPLDAQYLLSAPVAGVIQQVSIRPLQSIGQGQAVATVYSAELSHWQSEVLRAQEQQALASAALKRETLLWQDGIIAEKRVIEARSMLAHATLNLTQSRQRLALMGASTHPKQLSSQLTIHSPHQGTVSELLVSLGQYVEAGTPIAKVVRSSKLALELYATMAQSQQVRVGDRVTVQGCTSQGRVQSIAPNLSAQTQRQVIVVDWPQTTCVKPAQYIHATVRTSMPTTTATAWRVPSAAVVRQGQQNVVFIQLAQGFEAIPVQARAMDGQTQLIQGTALHAGQTIVVQGALTLKSIANGLGADQAPVAATR